MSCRIKLIVERLMLIKSNTMSSVEYSILLCIYWKEAEEQEKEEELVPTTTTNTVAEEIVATKEPAETTTSSRKPSKITRHIMILNRDE